MSLHRCPKFNGSFGKQPLKLGHWLVITFYINHMGDHLPWQICSNVCPIYESTYALASKQSIATLSSQFPATIVHVSTRTFMRPRGLGSCSRNIAGHLCVLVFTSKAWEVCTDIKALVMTGQTYGKSIAFLETIVYHSHQLIDIQFLSFS